MKILFQNSKNRKFTTLDVDPQASLESVRDELKEKHSFPEGVYTFIHKGKILRNPGPFSSLKENTKIIVYIKDEAPKPPEEEEEEHQQIPFGQGPQRPQRIPSPQQQQQARQHSEQQIIDLISGILNSAMGNNLVERVYQQENNFYDHPKEVNEISQILDESTCALMCEFIIRHFEVTLNTFELPPDRILAIIGNNVQMRSRCISDYEASVMELSNEQRAAFERLKNLNYDPIITLDTFIACEYNEERTAECLAQIHS